jgi:hypothetical protein
MSKQTSRLKPKIMSEYFFISRVICPMEFGDDDHPLDAVNCKLAQKYIGEFCESMLARIDINIDFYLLELPEDADAVPVKFISGDDIEPHCANLITLGKEDKKHEYLNDESGDSIFSRMDRLKPEMFSAEWYKNCNSFVSADT